jgi:predicted DNA-binding transcriptional regulator AlpA
MSMINETPMLFPMAPAEFWKQIKSTIEEVVKANINQTTVQSPPTDHLPEKALLKLCDVCAVFQVSKPTLYDWLRQNKLKSFKIKSRRYFLRTDIEAIIRNHEDLMNDRKAI